MVPLSAERTFAAMSYRSTVCRKSGHSLRATRTAGVRTTGPMHPRHARSSRSLSVGHLIATVQLGFPEAVVQARLDGADPNRSFAARQLDVSHADVIAIRATCNKNRSIPAVPLKKRSVLPMYKERSEIVGTDYAAVSKARRISTLIFENRAFRQAAKAAVLALTIDFPGHYAKGCVMGYSSPKKQLDLKEFLSKPGKPRHPRYNWTRTAMPPSKTASADKPVAKVA